MDKKQLNTYELALVIDPSQDETQRDKLITLIEKLAKQVEGEVSKRDDAGKKILAYPIKKNNEGWYFYLNLKLPSKAVEQFNTKLKMEEALLRFLIIKKA